MAKRVRWVAVACTGVVLGAASAHVLELPNKLAIDGPLWLAVQQNLYRGWGPFLAPFELVAIASAWLLAWMSRGSRRLFVPSAFAAACISVALLVFFAVIAPVNDSFAGWTAATLPSDWTAYRLRWELGHALHFALVLCAFVALLRTALLSQPFEVSPLEARSVSPPASRLA